MDGLAYRGRFCGTLLLLALPVFAVADGPTTYSMTVHANLVPGEVDLVSRDGNLEAVDQTVNGQHAHILYDFKAHKLYNHVDGSPCGVQDFADAAAPEPFDLIAGNGFLGELMAGNPKLLGPDTVNGIPSLRYTVTSNGTTNLFWVAEPQKFLVKDVASDGSGKSVTLIEMSALSFAKPAPGVFAMPAGC